MVAVESRSVVIISVVDPISSNAPMCRSWRRFNFFRLLQFLVFTSTCLTAFVVLLRLAFADPSRFTYVAKEDVPSIQNLAKTAASLSRTPAIRARNSFPISIEAIEINKSITAAAQRRRKHDAPSLLVTAEQSVANSDGAIGNSSGPIYNGTTFNKTTSVGYSSLASTGRRTGRVSGQKRKTGVVSKACTFDVNMTRAAQWTNAQLVAATYQLCFKLFKQHGGEENMLFKNAQRSNQTSNLGRVLQVVVIGGAEGREVRWARHYWQADVLLVEPCKAAHDVAARRFSRERAHVQLVHAAVGDRSGLAVLRHFRKSNGSTYTTQVSEEYNLKEKEELVNVITFNSVWEKAVSWKNMLKFDLLLLTCEGCEFAVIQQLVQSGLVKRFHTIAIRLHCFPVVGFTKPKLLIMRQQLAKTHQLVREYMCNFQKWTRL